MGSSKINTSRRDAELEMLFNASPDGIILHDAEARIHDVNNTAVDRLGYTREQLLSMEVTELEAEYSHEQLVSLWDEMSRDEQKTIEGRHRKADGSTFPVEVSIRRTTFDSEDLFLSLCRDITERKALEQQLNAEPGFLERAIDGLPYPFYVLDVEDYTVEHANSKATVAEGDTCYEVTHCRDTPCDEGDNPIACPISDVIESSEATTVEHIHHDEAGRERIFEVLASPITNDSGDVVKIAESNIDVTERVEYERRLEQQRDNLKILNKIVRHDIRNDLQLILAYAEMLEGNVEPGNEEYVRQVLGAARNAVDITTTARDVTDVMLQQSIEPAAIELRPILENEIEDIRSSNEQALVTVDVPIPDVEVRANDMLKSVVRNLLKNAIVHNDKEIPEVTVSTTTTDGVAQIRVADNGPGIPDRQKAQIFEEGETGLDSTGTGLGLYLVQTLVDRYEGKVWVEDNDPEGSVFIVELPLVDD